MVALFLLPGFVLSELPLKVIKNPKPNMIEKRAVLLEKVGEIGDEVAKDEFLFLPFSVTMDRQKNLFIYDMLQAKILKFDSSLKFIKSFGGVGGGPGEFQGKGRSYAVYINVAQDGKLYAHDMVARKVSVFDTGGKFITHILNKELIGPSFFKPIIDTNGSLVHQCFKDDRVTVYNDKGETLYSIMHKEKEKEILFIEEKVAKGADVFWDKTPFHYNGDELKMSITADWKLVLYFDLSATLHVVNLKDKKVMKTFRIWPEKAIEMKKTSAQRKESGYSPLFRDLFPDGDQNNFFYLDFGLTNDRSRHCIYKLSLDGELAEVFCIPGKKGTHCRFLLKQNNLFFTVESEQIIIYKEKEK